MLKKDNCLKDNYMITCDYFVCNIYFMYVVSKFKEKKCTLAFTTPLTAFANGLSFFSKAIVHSFCFNELS